MKNTTGILRRTGYLVYGGVCYAIFLLTFSYAVGFVGNLWAVLRLPSGIFRNMDLGGPPASLAEAALVDLALLGVFALQHSVMARPAFKRAWTRIVPPPIERSTFVLAASLCLALLFWQWRPIGTVVVWDASHSAVGWALIAVSFVGWLVVLCSTFMIDHFELFGLRQVWSAFRDRTLPETAFVTPALYRAVRHPIYLGFIVAFWATPIMTLGHLVFAAATTGYILVAIRLEEHDLVARYGDAYREYRGRVRMLLPLPRTKLESLRGSSRHREA